MSPPRNISSARPRLSRQSSLTNEQPAPAPARRTLLRRQRSADDERPITQLLQSALKVTASALGPGIITVQPPPVEPPKPPKPSHGPLRPVRVAWAELRSREHQRPSTPKQPTCLPALARANLDIFLAHSGLAQCLANIDLGPQLLSPKGVEAVKVSPREVAKASPREVPIKAALTPIPRTPTLVATSRRVNFKNASRMVNRSFNESPEPQKLVAPPEPKGVRILSAPAHRTAPILTPARPMLRSLPRRSPLNSSFESETSTDNRVKSAPSRRRLKSAGRGGVKRGPGRKGDDSSDDDESLDPPPVAGPVPQRPATASAPFSAAAAAANAAAPRACRRGLRVGAEIVTMVSLISPAHSSDSESEAAPPGAHQVVPVPGAEAAPAWQEREPSSPDAGKAKNPPITIVCARKINKSVSFQSRSSLPELLRRASIQLTKSDNEESSAVEPKEIERDAKTSLTAPPTPAVKATAEKATVAESGPSPPVAGIMKAPTAKRKLVRTKAVVRQSSKVEFESKPSKDASSDSQSVSSVDSVIKREPDVKNVADANPTVPISILKPPSAPLASAEEMDFASIDGSPKFESPKEQECWHLYRKMCEKGLTVSFDTVLRGMLTPTEYRLRKGALLSSY